MINKRRRERKEIESAEQKKRYIGKKRRNEVKEVKEGRKSRKEGRQGRKLRKEAKEGRKQFK